MEVSLECVCCRNCPVESTIHLLFLCPEAVATWFHLSNLLSSPILKIEATVEKIWEESWRMVKRKGKMRKKEWVTRFICTAWHIWKNRNDILFNRHKTEAKALAYRSYKEMELWLKHV